MVPKGWIQRKLGELVEIKHGFAFDSNHFNTKGNGLKLLTPAHFLEKGGYKNIGEKQKYYDGPVPDGYLLRKGDLLVVMTEQAPGLLGSPVLIPEDRTFLHNQRLGLVQVAHPEAILPEFLFHVFNRLRVRREIFATAGGTKVRHSSPRKICAVSSIFPPPREQARICSILGVWADAIEVQNRQIIAKQRLMRGLLKELFSGKRRFSEFGKPALGNVLPDGWRYSRLGDLISINTRTLPEDTDPSYEFHYLELSDVDRGCIRFSEELVSFQNAPSRARRQVKRGDILMSTVRPRLEGFGRYLGDLNNVVASTGFAVLSDEGQSDMSFVYHLIYSPGVQRQLAGVVIGSSYPAVSASDIRLLKVPTPHLEEQARIGKVLDCLQREIFLCSAFRDKLSAEHQALRYGLMTKEIGVRC